MNNHKLSHCFSNIPDYGPKPVILNLDQLAKENRNYRTAVWTGEHLQVTLMSIPVGGDVGLEMHPDTDQMIRVASGYAWVKIGQCQDHLSHPRKMEAGKTVFIPAGTWHNILNAGRTPLKLYSVYAPPHHPFGTVQPTKADAQSSDEHW